jgi:hypothetical protein
MIAARMKKVLVAVLWIALLNGTFVEVLAEYSVHFATITRQRAYDLGETYGAAFFWTSVVLIVYLAVTNRLPGAGGRSPNRGA